MYNPRKAWNPRASLNKDESKIIMGTYVLVSLALTSIFATICGLKICFLMNETKKEIQKTEDKLNQYNNDWVQERLVELNKKLKKQMKSRLWYLLAWCLFIFGLTYFINWSVLPAIDFSRPGFYWELLLVLAFTLLAFQFDDECDYKWSWKAWYPLLCAGFLMVLTSFVFGHWMQESKHQSLLDMNNDDIAMIVSKDTVHLNQDSLFSESISPVSLEKMRVVSDSVARMLAETLMGQITAFGSQYEIGELSLQSISGSFNITDGLGKKYHLSFDNDFIYVAPLEFRSFWKWRETKGVSHAYIIVSATNENIYHLVTEVNGQPIEIKYLNSACFSKNLRRYLRNSGFMGKISDTGIQIDGNGRPYNIFAKIENQIGWCGDKVVGSLVVDVQDGEIKEYSLADTPNFIDIVQPESLLRKNIYKHYDLIHGFWNWSDKDILRPADKLQVVYGDNTCCYYTGLSSTGNDQSTSGFVLSDAKTGVTTFYKMSGINESRAESAIDAHEWTAKYPSYMVGSAVMYNISGLQTYYAPIISGNKIVGHGFCYAKNVNVVGAGKTKEEAFAAYMRAYHLSQQNQSLPSDAQNMEGQILTIKKMRQEGSRYNFLFEEYEGKTFYTFSEITPDVRWIDASTKKVVVDFRMSDDKLIPIKNITAVK